MVWRFVEARRGFKRAWRKPSGPRRPARPLLGFQAGPPAFVFGSVGGQASSPIPAAQPGAQGDAGLRLGLFSQSSARPRPLARALGASKKEQGRAGRAGPPGTFGCGCSARFGRVAVWPFAELGRVAGSGFLVRRGAWLGCPVRHPIRLRHAVFRLWPDPRFGGLLKPAAASGGRGASRPAPVAPSGLCPGFSLGRPLSFLVQSGVRHRRPFRGPTRRSRGRGLCIGLRSRHFPPRPLARALGAQSRIGANKSKYQSIIIISQNYVVT